MVILDTLLTLIAVIQRVLNSSESAKLVVPPYVILL